MPSVSTGASPPPPADTARSKLLARVHQNDEDAETRSLPTRPDECRLTIEVPENRLHTSTSMTSLNIRMKRRINKIRHNQCVGVVVLLTLGALFNGLAYMASVWSAELNAELIDVAVAKHEQSFNFKFKKGLSC